MSSLQPGVILRVATIAIVISVALLLAWSALAIAAEPTLTPVPSASGGPNATSGAAFLSGDIRSEGAGPGLVGSPLVIMLGVIMLGAGAAAATAVVSRLTKHS